LLGRRVVVVARVRPERAAAADHLVAAQRALAGVAGALLAVRLLVGAAHLGHGAGRVRARALPGALPLHHLPQEVLVDLGAPHLVVEVDGADGRAGEVFDVEPHVLISTSTPADRSSFISASSVCCVGSRMSRSRLWVRISNCSRDFLSTCGDRSTQYLLILVGKGIGPATLALVRRAVSTISAADWSRSLWSYALSRMRIFGIVMFYSMILVTTPAPTVRPPSRMAKRSPSSQAIGVMSSTSRLMLS